VSFHRCLTVFALLAACAIAQADCPSTLPLKGALNIDNCYPMREDCVLAADALYEYSHAMPDNSEDVLRISTQGSPWHLYDADSRIITIDSLAGMVRQQGDKIRQVVPDRHRKALAQQLSQALGTIKVSGPDGFLWYDKDGKTAVTQQAFTVFATGPYAVRKGDKVMASLVAGWPALFEDAFAKQRNADGLLRAGVGHEAFSLCPERALKAFDAAAALGNPVAAYNAAVLRFERGANGDREAALALLKKAAAAGDSPAATLLDQPALQRSLRP